MICHLNRKLIGGYPQKLICQKVAKVISRQNAKTLEKFSRTVSTSELLSELPKVRYELPSELLSMNFRGWTSNLLSPRTSPSFLIHSELWGSNLVVNSAWLPMIAAVLSRESFSELGREWKSASWSSTSNSKLVNASFFIIWIYKILKSWNNFPDSTQYAQSSRWGSSREILVPN